MSRFRDKVAIITGGAAGIGADTTRLFAKGGARIVIADLPNSPGEELAQEIRDNDGRALFIACDVTNPAQVESMVAQTVEEFGGLHIAVNNAGIGGALAPTADYTLEDWKRVIDINLNGVFYSMKYEIPALLDSGGGAIVNLASILGLVGFENTPAYSASKHGVIGLTQAASLEYASKGVRINAVGPGYTETAMIRRFTDDPEAKQMLVDLHPIGRLGRGEEIANLIAFLASDEASFITGAYYPADGGYLAR